MIDSLCYHHRAYSHLKTYEFKALLNFTLQTGALKEASLPFFHWRLWVERGGNQVLKKRLCLGEYSVFEKKTLFRKGFLVHGS